MANLPTEFLKRIQEEMTEEEAKEFLQTFSKPRFYGLRVNTLKISVENFLALSPLALRPVPWCSDGFYYEEQAEPGKHPHYYAGLYYIQEPSAMVSAPLLEAKPGEKILDLCAAPGGKTLQLAAQMQGKGFLVANEVNPERVRTLLKNIELYGARNVLVTNDRPLALAQKFPLYFDKILVDAPCSGEGTFRKDRSGIQSATRFSSVICAPLQKEILAYADRMLKPNGRLLYSTCTFHPEENERTIHAFLKEHENYELLEIPKREGFEGGRPSWCFGFLPIEKTLRLWPHRISGEGHFVALFQKRSGAFAPELPAASRARERSVGKKPGQGRIQEADLAPFYDFVQSYLTEEPKGIFYREGNHIFLLPENLPNLEGLHVLKLCWYLGETEHGLFTPSHSFLCALPKQSLQKTWDLRSGSDEMKRYLRGESFTRKGEKGYLALCMDGYTVGWAKYSGGTLKNLYPKGWRKMS